MSVSRRLRFEILRRDGHRCFYCGASAPDVKLTVDHVLAITLGGSDEASNLVTACQPCNAGKSSMPADAAVVAAVDVKAALMADALRSVMANRQVEAAGIAIMLEQFDNDWGQWSTGTGDREREVDKDPNWRTSTSRFIDLGYDNVQLKWFIRVAMESQAKPSEKWRYFCGVVWKDFRQVQEYAAAIVDRGAA